MLYQILLVLPLLLVAHVIHRYLRLRHIPGPFLASVSKLWLLKWVVRGAVHTGLLEASRKYGGPVVRVGPNEVVTNDPDFVRRINAVRSPYTRSSWYDSTAFDHKRNHVFCERDEVKHMELRNQMLAGYSGKENVSLEASIDTQLSDFIGLIEEKYLSSPSAYRPVDFARIAQYLALDVITNVAFGQPFGFLHTDSDVHDYIKIQKALLPVFEWFSTLPSLERLMRFGPISKLSMPTPRDSKGLGRLMGVAEKIVDERYDKASGGEPRSDMLGSFIRHGLPREQAKMETVLQVMAGSDTSVAGLRMTVLSLSTSPDALRRVVAELDAADAQGQLSKPMAQEAEIRAHLPYLCACVKESLRLRPPVASMMLKEVPPSGDELNGLFLPGGTLVGFNPWALQRSQEVYGVDADIYRPSRWTDTDDAEQLAAMARSADLVFGYGKNGCLGKPVALMELHKALTELLRRFDISVNDALQPMQSLNRNGLFVQSDMWVRISPRRTVG